MHSPQCSAWWECLLAHRPENVLAAQQMCLVCVDKNEIVSGESSQTTLPTFTVLLFDRPR